MIYTAVVKDGGLFIPNIPPDLANQAIQSPLFQVELIPVTSSDNNMIPDSMLQAAGILKDVDGVVFQDTLRQEWD